MSAALDIILKVVFLGGAGLIVIILHKLMIKLNKQPDIPHKEQTSLRKDSYYNAELQRILIRIKLELQACKVTLARFHNGGCFANGLDMRKFTVTHETTGGSKVPLMDKCVSVLNSRYGIAFEQLAIRREYVVYDVDDCNDTNFKRDMGEFGFKATYIFLIKQNSGIDEGFVGVNFSDSKILTPEQRDIVREQIPRIIDLVNMKEEIQGMM
jgi:hypothetical protein